MQGHLKAAPASLAGGAALAGTAGTQEFGCVQGVSTDQVQLHTCTLPKHTGELQPGSSKESCTEPHLLPTPVATG